ncbi:unnamed protein product, partial [Ectocarpus sp. 12 AP-2014]
GSSNSWYSNCIDYPKSNKKARDWSAEAKFAAAWRPSSSSGSAVLSTEGAGRQSNVTPPPREKRPRDCQPPADILPVPPPSAKQAAREGAGRPKGSFGRKRLRAMMKTYQARVEQNQLVFAGLHVRDLSSAMFDAAREVDRHEKDWRQAFLKRQSNRGVRRTEALRKLAKHRSQLEEAALAAAARKAGWEKGVEYFRAVVKECQSAVAATSAGLDVSVDLAGILSGKLLIKALALRAVYTKLLEGVSRREAFEASAEFIEMSEGTIKQSELEYRTKGHIVVSAMIPLLR